MLQTCSTWQGAEGTMCLLLPCDGRACRGPLPPAATARRVAIRPSTRGHTEPRARRAQHGARPCILAGPGSRASLAIVQAVRRRPPKEAFQFIHARLPGGACNAQLLCTPTMHATTTIITKTTADWATMWHSFPLLVWKAMPHQCGIAFLYFSRHMRMGGCGRG